MDTSLACTQRVVAGEAALLLPGRSSFCSCTGDLSLCQPGVYPEHYENKHQGEKGKELDQVHPTKWHRASNVSLHCT